MLISIVTGTYNRKPLLQKMILSVRAQLFQGIDHEFIVVDGGSTDGTIEWCKAQDDIFLIEHGELRGAIKAFCEGARAAQGDYVIMANDDIWFHEHSIIRALVYMENHSECGAVAFADNRYNRNEYRVMEHPARTEDNRLISSPYAQVGMFRRWLGNLAGWWGDKDQLMSKARTYGGDDYLSSRIWEMGYTIEAVQGCVIEDGIEADGLRIINNGYGVEDSAIYYTRYKGGALFNSRNDFIPQEHNEQLRILYLPIFEGVNEVQRQQKRGLRDALSKLGIVAEYDYIYWHTKGVNLHNKLVDIAQSFKPHILFTQFHSTKEVKLETIKTLRTQHPHMICVNWNGDYWPDVSLEPSLVDMLKWYDMALVVNTHVVEAYEEMGISSAYWQAAAEEPDTNNIIVPKHDVLFLANAYSEWRQEWGKTLKSLPYNVGLYGSGWGVMGNGQTLYDFAQSQALIHNAKINIGDNQYNDGSAFCSNRLFEVLYAGGFLLHQRVDGLQKATGLRANTHYAVFDTLEELPELVAYWITHPEEREAIRIRGQRYVQEKHSFDARVKQLFLEILPEKVYQYATV